MGWVLGLVPAAVAVGALGMAIGMGLAGPLGRFLDFYCGVFALVSLSLATMVGLLATDRMILAPRHRVRAQAAHRALAFTAVSMLVAHLGTQMARHRVGMMDAFMMPSSVTYGLGTLAFYLLVVAVVSGIVRGRFALTKWPWAWRVLHLTAYAAWPMGIWHGLTAGREAAPWVKASYAFCFAAVLLALAVRPFLRRSGRP